MGLWLAWMVGAWATVCDTASTATLTCFETGYGRSSAVIDNLHESDGLDQYSCSPLVHTGAERVTTFTCHYTNVVRLDLTGTDCDVDLLVLGDTCDPRGDCLASNTAVYDAVRGTAGVYSATFVCEAGHVYTILVENKVRPAGVACPFFWRDMNFNGLQDPDEVGPGSRFRLYGYCEESCVDGQDNDRDLQADCQDLDCWSGPECCDVDGDGSRAQGPPCGGNDCDDADPGRRPGLAEIPGDGVDSDCDGRERCWTDADNDGWGVLGQPGLVADLDCDDPGEAARSGDCQDRDPNINPGVVEVPADGTDGDCDGVDDCWRDLDLDGYGSADRVAGDNLVCTDLPGEAARSGDCDDARADRFPGRLDVPGDGIDQDCDGVDLCWADGDGDGYGVGAPAPGAGPVCSGRWAPRTGDCDDGDPTVRPEGVERCGGVDEDCDGRLDEAPAVGEVVWYADLDGDGFGGLTPVPSCLPVPGAVTASGDCDDQAAAVSPAAVEACDGRDNDCDGLVDDADTVAAVLSAFLDLDGDGWGGLGQSLAGCALPPGYTLLGGDCADGDAGVSPGAVEVAGDSVDQDCDGADACWLDADGDGWGAGAPGPGPGVVCAGGWAPRGGDCDDAASGSRPGGVERCGGLDEDCDGEVDEVGASGEVDVWPDLDGDGFGGVGVPVRACAAPVGFSAAGGDCDEARAGVSPGAPERCDGIDNDCDGQIDDADAVDAALAAFVDRDGDGFGDPAGAVTLAACALPAGFSLVGGDCADADVEVGPARPEVPADGRDQDCDGVDACWADGDGDGWGAEPAVPGASLRCEGAFAARPGDCDPARPDVHPDAPEVCDGIDDDCDGLVDDADALDVALVVYADADGDGFGDEARSRAVAACGPPDGSAAVGGDCDDRAAAVSPAAVEVAGDGVDQDCDGVDACWRDDDRDGWGTGEAVPAAPRCADGWAARPGDCDDLAAAARPDGVEACGGGDEDCDGAVDEAGAVGESTFYADLDGDGYGGSAAVLACAAPVGHVAVGGDCADALSGVHPDAPERCDGIDNDCDALVDDADVADAELIAWVDADGDGYGDPAGAVRLPRCALPAGYAPVAGDCADADPSRGPLAIEVPYDGIDQDCSGLDLVDVDGDGWPGPDVDCDDRRSAVRPGGVELANGIDDDCDGAVDRGTAWFDGDGDGFTPDGGDCDDATPARRPGAVEACDGVDEDCDGVVDEETACRDDDGDGVDERGGDCNDGDPTVWPGAPPVWGVDSDCDGVLTGGDADGDGVTADGGDCADLDAAVRPGVPEVADGVDQDCDGAVDEGTALADDDGDGWSEADGDCWDGDATVFPGAPEGDDGVDDDCDGVVDEGGPRRDDDGDGVAEVGGDCDDADPARAPGRFDGADGVDDDCDGLVDEDARDPDGDGVAADQGDCDETSGWVNATLPEICDGVDNDCDGVVDDGCEVEVVVVREEGSGGCDHRGGGGLAGVAGVLLWRRRRG